MVTRQRIQKRLPAAALQNQKVIPLCRGARVISDWLHRVVNPHPGKGVFPMTLGNWLWKKLGRGKRRRECPSRWGCVSGAFPPSMC